MSVDVPNVMCSVIKPAEMNGDGLIVRLNETQGRETRAVVSLPMLPEIKSVTMVSLVENDTEEVLPVSGNSFRLTMPKFGVKTVRVLCEPASVEVKDLQAKSVADMQVELKWDFKGKGVSHFNVYRDTRPECVATMLNFIGQSAGPEFSDIPRPNIGGWIRSCLAPRTKHYYRVVAVDRVNNRIGNGSVAEVTTLASAEKNLPPVAVEGVRPILVSPITRDNTVNLLFRTSCEPDVTQYEVHRSTASCFAAGPNTLVGVVKSDDIPPRSGGYGESAIQYQNTDYDHAMFTDNTVPPDTLYYLKVRAVDSAGQKGAFSDEVSIRTKGAFLPGWKVTAQSVYAPEYAPELALNGDSDPFRAWISKQYGGGTKAQPQAVWWAVELLKETITIKGVKIIGDHRDVIPLQKKLQVQVREGGGWKTVGELKDATTKDATIVFAQPVTTDILRVFVPAADLPKSENADVDGIVRICELLVLLPGGGEVTVDAVSKK
jgi:hypothetical protein